MSSGLSCPNPACDHVFTPATVAGVAIVVCPRCGHAFRFQASTSTSGTPAEPFALPAEPHRSPGRSYRRSSRMLVNYSVFAVFLLALAAVGFRAYRWYTIQHAALEKAGGARQVMTARDYNCEFTVPPHWQEDEDLRGLFKANLLALRRSASPGWFALTAHDYEDHTPPLADVVPVVVEQLSGYFNPTNLECSQAREPGPSVAGQPSVRLKFQGEFQATPMAGQAYVWAARGIAYWLVCWAPRGEANNLESASTDLAAHFSLLHERDRWKQKRPPVHEFIGPAEAFRVRDTQGLWQKEPRAHIVDPAAQLLLEAHDPQAPDDVARQAQCLILSIGSEPDLPAAAMAARKHFELRERNDNPDIAIEPVSPSAKAGSPARIGNVQGIITSLHVAGDNRKRLIVLAIVRLPQQVWVVQLDAPWERRDWWEQEFTRLLDTFHCRAE